jgi:hypothetical protein
MSTQSPQTGGKSGQAPGQTGGKGFGGGGFQPENSNLTQDMLSNLQQPNNQQMPPIAAASMQQPDNSGMMGQIMVPQRPSPMPQPMGQDMLGSGVGQTQSTNPQQSAGGKGIAGGTMNAASQQMPYSDKQEQAGMGQGNITYPSQSGQPVMGMPNAYSNTVGQPNTPMTPMNSGAGMPGGKSSQQNGKMGR